MKRSRSSLVILAAVERRGCPPGRVNYEIRRSISRHGRESDTAYREGSHRPRR